ncbi:shikimate kinase [Thermobispora bispora]|uniref:Shikimate kinase n=1 Tax=Thermobispora bispora (strain ATCC 19993 / DSM 43833 / CBS 139.67 / JCM 10125 / KCTC 9307 / NBRC 14880 / R51) TaxID=469371 RepID=D6Y344_THEBD|nr:shikimate kinase [Thermobispora bispora]MBO2473487.1 shikimate kinase [Actinomycetales bacterium]MDI9579891.1 shikimate kinase [Thermobispora sp.]ADG88919.1 Shikimate kinase [Thermobispora bispora DSM 43833]MBX6168299.1 shikimate kinase [Thermobispora bispora]QSI48663.1 shikimate kinase [Thermobispora bispora]
MGSVVVLIGPPGAGKTTVGRILADRLGVPFRDTDADVEAVAGKPVSDIFIEDGEARFRELEAEAVRQALATHDGVLSLGGGAILHEPTQRLLEDHRVVYLEVGLDQAVKRVGLATARPLLVLNPRSQLRKLMEERRPIYERLADITVKTDGRDPEDVASEIAAAL